MNDQFKFQLNEDEIAKFKEWKKLLKKLPPAAIGGSYTFCFTPTGVGTSVTVVRIDGQKIDLTDYDKW
jgi:hypothetical protein